jgi:hypothetical protein
MNNIQHLKGIGKGKRIFLVGNGPSLNDMNLDLLENEDSIAMNRIELIYPKTKWRPTYYIFCSSNCQDKRWGKGWSKSVVKASKEPKTLPLIWDRYKDDIEKNANTSLDESTIYLTNFTENEVGQLSTFSVNAEDRLDKSGTTMNVALQLAYYMDYNEVYLIGIDSNWKTLKYDDETIEVDKNHFHPYYHAYIENGKEEFWRMNTTHKIAKKFFDIKGVKIMNAGLNSAIDVYEKVDFRSLFK